MRFVGPHWSASRFMLFEQCPGEYKARYVDGVALELTEALAFGNAMHMALEAHYAGQDGESAFRAAWKVQAAEAGVPASRLTGMGLALLDKVFELNLSGVPERGFSLDTEVVLGAPIVGAIDLVGDGVIYDFKTTRGRWSADRAETELWQPILYSWAIFNETGRLPEFEYIVLNRVTGQVDRFHRAWNEDIWGKQWAIAYGRMRAIQEAVAAGDLECHGRHGYCPECGDRWGHEHICDAPTVRRIRL